MDNFRACPPKELGGSEVVLVKDYKTLKATDNTGKATDLDMPETSNVLQFFTADGTKVSDVLPEQNLRLSSTWKSRAKCTVRSAMQVP